MVSTKASVIRIVDHTVLDVFGMRGRHRELQEAINDSRQARQLKDKYPECVYEEWGY